MALEFRRGGRRVTADQLFEGMAADMIRSAEEEVERRLRTIRDPETGEPVEVTRTDDDGTARWNVRGSPAAIELARKIIEGES